jgi:hypothetical protein
MKGLKIHLIITPTFNPPPSPLNCSGIFDKGEEILVIMYTKEKD